MNPKECMDQLSQRFGDKIHRLTSKKILVPGMFHCVITFARKNDVMAICLIYDPQTEGWCVSGIVGTSMYRQKLTSFGEVASWISQKYAGFAE